MTEKAPSLHAELQNQLAAQQRAQEAAQQYERGQQNASGGGGSTKQGGEQEDPDAFYYSMLGWGTFAVVAMSWLVMMNVQAARAQT